MEQSGSQDFRQRIFDGIAKPLNRGATQVHVTTLDEVVSVNSFFTVAVFIGMAFTSGGKDTYFLDSNQACRPSPDTMKRLLVFEVVSFSCFLFSSLVAHGMKLFVVFSNSKDRGEVESAVINNKFLRFGMLASAIGSIMGTLLLMLSMVNIIQLRLGKLSCEDGWSDAAAVPLIVLVVSGITIFISSVFYAFLH